MADGLGRTIDEMTRRDVDVLVLGREGNARFVSGATRLWLAGTRPFAPGCVVVRETGAVHLLSITDFGVPSDIPLTRLYPMSWNPTNIMGALAAIPGVSRAQRVGVDGMTPLFDQLFVAMLPHVDIVDGEALIRAARRVKSAVEVERIRAAISLGEEALSAAVDALQPGVRESELKGVFEERICQLGSTTPAFEATFCAVDDGPIRRLVSDRVITDGDLVALDVGVLRDGWEGSLARTWSCGAPSADHHRRRSSWTEQWARLVALCRAGTRARDLRAIGPGAAVHGVGLGYEGLDDDDSLRAGMVVRLELEADGILAANTLLVGDGRHETLTMFPPAAVGR